MAKAEAGLRWEIVRGVIPPGLAMAAGQEALDLVTSGAPFVQLADLPSLRSVSVFNIDAWIPGKYGDEQEETFHDTHQFVNLDRARKAVIGKVPQLRGVDQDGQPLRALERLNINVYEPRGILEYHIDEPPQRMAVRLLERAWAYIESVDGFSTFRGVLEPGDGVLFCNQDRARNAGHEFKNLSGAALGVSMVI